MLTLLWSVFIFLLVILFHEFGHFIVAKSLGVRINEFSIGMGPAVFQKDTEETKYSLRLLPVGGYVSMEGEDEASDDPRSFSQSPVWKRMAIIVAGALMNFVLAMIVLLFAFGLSGRQIPVIASFPEDSALEKAGFLPGDRILSIDEEPINDWNELLDRVAGLQEGTPAVIRAERQEEVFEATVIPYQDASGRILVGIIPETEKDPAYAWENAIATFGFMLSAMVDFFRSLFRGAVGLNDLSGPVAIVGAIGQASAGGIYSVLLLLAFISVNVGFFNLLPIPALDGGKMVFLLIEAIRGKPLPVEKESMVHLIGFALLMLLIIVVTFKDVLRLGVFGG